MDVFIRQKIEEVVAKAQHEVDESIMDAAEQAILEVGIPTLPREVLKVFGRFKNSEHLLDKNIFAAFQLKLHT